MATTRSTHLQALAAVRDEHEAAISVYIDPDPADTPTTPDLMHRTRSAIDAMEKARPEHPRDARLAFDAGAAQIQQFLTDEDIRVGHVHGAALFALGDSVFESHPMWRSAGDAAAVGRRFALRRLAAEQSRTSRMLLLMVGRELGRLLLFRDGTLLELLDADEDVENRHHQGGWAQMKLQHYVDRQAELHIDRVVDLLDQVHVRIGKPPIVIAATDENAGVVRDRLGQDAAASVAGELGNAKDMSEPALLAELTRIAGEQDAAREDDLLERRAAQIGRGEGVEPLDDVLTAVSDARVETLLIARGAEVEVFSCPQCGRLSDHAQVCPVDGSFIQDDRQGVEAAVAEAISRGGDVWELLDVDRRDLDAGGGLGAILRF